MLTLLNPQHTTPLDLRLLRRILIHHLEKSLALKNYDLTIHLINADAMTRLNAEILGHTGSTDVITLDYSDPATLTGEIFVCIDEAILQARRFRTTWQQELIRYLIHAILHLQGHDDLKPATRRKMKLEENRRLRQITRDFPLSKLRRKPRVSA
jgi:probable rRNA maturation factor